MKGNGLQDRPLVSVMIPVYNGEKTIRAAIGSLLAQTYTSWKCIIIDDGSTDGTRDILWKYRDDARFKIVHLPENRGRGFARQTGLDLAEGKYLAFLDADDLYHPEKLEVQVRFMEENEDVELVACGIGSFDGDLVLRSVRGKGNNRVVSQAEDSPVTGFFPASSMLRTRSAREHAYMTGLNAAEDVDYFRRLLGGKRYYVIPSVYYYYFEFGSTSGRKILAYYRHCLRSDYYVMRRQPLRGSVQAMKSLVKYMIYMVMLPLVGVDFFLERRGVGPDAAESGEFENVLTTINRIEYAEDQYHRSRV
jgi:glycosyltransferase involved in cell wall biosynthesis